MMFGEENRAGVPQARNFRANGLSQVKLFAEPSGKDARKCTESSWSNCQVGFEHTGEFRDRLVVEDNRIEVLGFEARVSETELDGIGRKAFVVFLAGESLFLGCGDYLPVRNERRGGIMIKGRDAQNMAHGPVT